MSEGSIKVLVVDDHQMFTEGLVKVLGEASDVAVVATASSVAGAVEAAKLHTPDVVLMDFELSDGDGAKATQLIKEDMPTTKVVMLTSFTDESVLVAAIEAGCSGFVTKHKAVDEVVAAVRAAFEGEALISPSMLARLLPKLRRSSRGLGSDLTPRELEVLKLLAEGMSNSAIAEKLVISLHTVRNHVQSIIMKLQAHSKLEAVTIAVRESIIQYPQNAPRT